MTGKSGADLYLPVPPGTEVRDAATGEVIGEGLASGDTLLVAKGGRGGRGNARFATPTHRSPREWEPGEYGEERQLELVRSEEHTSELQSRLHLVCRLLLEKKKKRERITN